jgi:hypothetical protein
MSKCPKGGEHQYRKTYEKDGWIEHTCRKCGDVIRRRQNGKAAA